VVTIQYLTGRTDERTNVPTGQLEDIMRSPTLSSGEKRKIMDDLE